MIETSDLTGKNALNSMHTYSVLYHVRGDRIVSGMGSFAYMHLDGRCSADTLRHDAHGHLRRENRARKLYDGAAIIRHGRIIGQVTA